MRVAGHGMHSASGCAILAVDASSLVTGSFGGGCFRARARLGSSRRSTALRRCRGLLSGRATLATSKSPTPRRGLFEQQPAFLESQSLGIAILWNLGVLFTVGDIRPVAAVQHLDPVHTEISDRAVRVGFLLQPDY